MDQVVDRSEAVPAFTGALPRRSAVGGALAALAATPAVAASPTPAGSIAALGRTIAGLWREHHQADLAVLATRDPGRRAKLRTRFEAIMERIDDLSIRALSMQAVTVADAAVQAALAADHGDRLVSATGGGTWARELSTALVTAHVSVALLLARAAGLDPETLGHSDIRSAAARAFGPAGVEG